MPLVDRLLMYSLFCLVLLKASGELSPETVWNTNGTTVAGWSNGTKGSSLSQLFQHIGIAITDTDVLYIADKGNHRVLAVSDSGPVSALRQFNTPTDVFIFNASVYVADALNARVQRIPFNGTNHTTAFNLSVSGFRPFYLHIDGQGCMYASDRDTHSVFFTCPNSAIVSRVAGTGVKGSSVKHLSSPHGIFVTRERALYVVDRYNQRIMKWLPGASAGLRVAGGAGKSGKSQLASPTDIVVDDNDYMYITDALNAQVLRWAPNSTFGVCIVACTNTSGIASNQLNRPHALIFDRHGTLYVSDYANNRIQAFSIRIPLNCSEPLIVFTPSVLPPLTTLTFRRNQHVYLTSQIELHCSFSSPMTTEWIILTCSPICANRTQLPDSIDTSQRHLHLPPDTLTSGRYHVQLTITMLDDSTLSWSSLLVIEIVSPRILTQLIPYDTTIITHDEQQDVILDPGRYSLDLTAISFHRTDWNYAYYCLTVPIDSWRFNDASHSSVTIVAGTLSANHTYQFAVHMTHRHHLSLQSIGYLTVHVETNSSPTIIIGCIGLTMCSPKMNSHYVNRHTQLALFSRCLHNCPPVMSIQWKSLFGRDSFVAEDILSVQTENLTVAREIFALHANSTYWRFQVVYSFELHNLTQTFDIELNDPPRNGSCSIDPSEGTLTTLFTVNCSNWFDEDRVKDYSIHGIRTGKLMMFTTPTSESLVQLRLPASIDRAAVVHVLVRIRDSFDAVEEYHLPPVIVHSDIAQIAQLVDALQVARNETTWHIVQLVTSICHFLNELNSQLIASAIRGKARLNTVLLFASLRIDGVPRTAVSITPLLPDPFPTVDFHSASSVTVDACAAMREQLMSIVADLSIVTPDDVHLQSSLLSQFTHATNQLTRKTLLASSKCLQLADALKSIANRLSTEDVQTTATRIVECAVNLFNGAHGPLQGRHQSLQVDQSFQANTITNAMIDIVSSITSALHIHLTVGQTIRLNTSIVLFTLEKRTRSALPNAFNLSDPVIFIRTIMQPLASFGDQHRNAAYTNLSRSFSLTVLDENLTELSVRTTPASPFEFFIPRDPNLIVPSMFRQNVTLIRHTDQLFHLHVFNLTQSHPNLTFSVHLEMRPLAANVSFLLIYKFDAPPSLFSMTNWTLFCPSNLTEDGMYLHFVDNAQTAAHLSIIYGVRELSLIEAKAFCFDTGFDPDASTLAEPVSFSSDYEIHVYQSGCFYLDANHAWQSGGLLVGPLTNHRQTQCLSTHCLTRCY